MTSPSSHHLGPTEAWSTLRDLAPEIAQAATRQWLATDPMAERLDTLGRRCLVDDAHRHLSHLASSVRVEQPAVFVEYVDWGRSLLESMGVPPASFAHHLERLGEAIGLHAPQVVAVVGPTLDQGLAVVGRGGTEPPSPLEDSAYPELASAVTDLLLAGEREQAGDLLAEVLGDGLTLEDIYLDVIQPSLREVGRRWQLRRITVAEEHLATAVAQYLLATLYPRMFREAPRAKGRLVATCVGNNLHEVGIRMVADLFTLDGWDATFLGASTPSRALVDLVVKQQVDLVAVSATMVDQLDEVGDLVSMLRSRSDAKVLVGGRPFLGTPELAAVLGADGTAPDARTARELANRLVAA